jgi:hypothetical protein
MIYVYVYISTNIYIYMYMYKYIHIGMLIGNPMMLIMGLVVVGLVAFPNVLKGMMDNEDFKKGTCILRDI